MSGVSGTECRWQVHGLTIAGLSWGKPDNPPVLCIHGWMDNAASFDALASLLPDYHVVAPDLTGHGRSDRRSADATYQIWDDLPEVKGVVEALGWDRFDLLGHSRGAIISALFAASFPECIRHLVLMDAVMPAPVLEGEFPRQMRRFLDDKGRLLQRDNRVFASIEDAAATREQKGLGAPAARILAERNLKPCDGGYTWTMDPRLQGASAVKLSRGQIQSVLGALEMPTLLFLASEGHGGKFPEITAMARASIPALEVFRVPGKHHFHMEESASVAAEKISEFLSR